MSCKASHLPACENGTILEVDLFGTSRVRFCDVCRPGQAALQRAGYYDPANKHHWSEARRLRVYYDALARAGIPFEMTPKLEKILRSEAVAS